MAEFTDDFDRADEAIESGDWIALDDTDDASNVARVSATALISNSTSARVACWYTGSVPTGIPQECEAAVVSSIQGSNCYVDVGVQGLSGDSGFATLTLGLWARLSWLSSGARRVSLMRFLPSDAAEATVEDVDLVSAGGIEVDGYQGALVSAGALGVMQRVRIVVTQDDLYGLRARVFLNSDDDDHAIIDAKVDHDFVGTGDTDQPYGRWWVGFGDAGSAGLAIGGVTGSDYTTDEGKVVQAIRSDQPTLGEITALVTRRYTRSHSGYLDVADVRDAIVDTIRDVRNKLGDQAWFLVRAASISLTIDPSTNLCTLPSYIERPLRIAESLSDVPIYWAFQYQTDEGANVVKVSGASGDYRVRYAMRWIEPSDPNDHLPFPRQHREALVAGACARLAQNEGRAEMADSFAALFSNGLREMQRDQARYSNMERKGFRAATIPFRYNSWPSW